MSAVLRALAGARPAGSQGSAELVLDLPDLEQLLAPRGGSGRLLLDADELPVVEIGFVLRFLERHPRWEVVLLGFDAGRPAARELLGRASVRFLRWPPDLDELENLLLSPPDDALAGSPPPTSAALAPAEERGGPPSVNGARSAPAAAETFQRLELALGGLRGALERGEDPGSAVSAVERAARELTPNLAPPESEVFDLHRLLEELVAESLLGGPPRFRYRAEGDLHVCASRRELKDALAQLFWIAARCSDDKSVVEIRAEGGPGVADPVEVSLDFPAGPLEGLDSRTALSRAALSERLSAEAAERAARAAGVLREQGARLRVGQMRPGRMKLELSLPRLAAEPLAAQPAEGESA